MKIYDKIVSSKTIDFFDRIYWRNGIAQEVPALTYFLVVSLAPFVIGITALAALLIGDDNKALQVGEHVAEFMPLNVRSSIVQLIVETHKNSLSLLIISIGFMIWSASGAIGVLERALSKMLLFDRHNPFVGKTKNLFIGFFFSLLVVVSFMTASAFVKFPEKISFHDPWLVSIGLKVLNAGFACILGTFILKVLCKEKVRWLSALAGGCFAGLSTQLIPTLVSFYISTFYRFAPIAVIVTMTVIIVGCWLFAHGLLFSVAICAFVEKKLEKRI